MQHEIASVGLVGCPNNFANTRDNAHNLLYRFLAAVAAFQLVVKMSLADAASSSKVLNQAHAVKALWLRKAYAS